MDQKLQTAFCVHAKILLLEEYGVTFGYLPGKIQKNVVTNALSYLDIDRLNIKSEEMLKLLSGSESNRISKIKRTILMHTALIFKLQAKVKDTRSREKRLAQTH
jgi:hypothetical protein